MAVPDGYSPYLRKSPLIEPWEPLYSKQLPDRVVIGLEVRRVHCNSCGLVHGGLISALADNAMGSSISACLATAGDLHGGNMLTVSLQVDFLGLARIGQWLEFDTVFVRTGRTLQFANCMVRADTEVIAKASQLAAAR